MTEGSKHGSNLFSLASCFCIRNTRWLLVWIGKAIWRHSAPLYVRFRRTLPFPIYIPFVYVSDTRDKKFKIYVLLHLLWAVISEYHLPCLQTSDLRWAGVMIVINQNKYLISDKQFFCAADWLESFLRKERRFSRIEWREVCPGLYDGHVSAIMEIIDRFLPQQ